MYHDEHTLPEAHWHTLVGGIVSHGGVQKPVSEKYYHDHKAFLEIFQQDNGLSLSDSNSMGAIERGSEYFHSLRDFNFGRRFVATRGGCVGMVADDVKYNMRDIWRQHSLHSQIW